MKQKHSLLPLLILLLIAACTKDDVQKDQNSIPENPTTPTNNDRSIDFVKTFGGSGDEEAVAVIETADKGFIVLATTNSNDGDLIAKLGTDNDYWLIKFDTQGSIQWSKTYGGSNDDVASSLNITNDGGYIISGYSRSNDGDVSGNEGFQDYWVIKTDAVGNIQWNQNFGFAGNDQGFEAFQTKDGGYFISGFIDVSASNGQGNDFARSTLHGVGEYWGIKLDANGNKIWRRYFGGSNNDRSYDAIETDDGGFIITGASESDDFDVTNSKGSYDFWAVHVDSAGDLIWTKNFGGSEIEVAYAAARLLNGNNIMVGDSRSSDKDLSSNYGNADAWIVTFNDNGELISQNNYGGTEFDSANSVFATTDGNLVITGNSRSVTQDLDKNNGQNDAWLFITDSSRNLIYSVTIGGSGIDFANDGLQTTNNNLIMVGSTESIDGDITFNKGGKDILITKIK